MNEKIKYIQDLELFFPARADNFSELNKFETYAQNESFLNFKTLNTFDAGFDKLDQEKQDVQYSLLLAQRAANKAFPEEKQVDGWYKKYFEVLQALGWLIKTKDYTLYEESTNLFELDKAIISLISDLLSVQQVKIFMKSLDLIKSLGNDDKRLKAFERNTHSHDRGNFQMGYVQMKDGNPTLTGSGFIIEADKMMTEILFMKFNRENIKMSFNFYKAELITQEYAKYRDLVINKLGDTDQFIATLDI